MAQLLEIKEDDGIWLFLLAHENYFRIFMEMPWAILSACKASLKEIMDVVTAIQQKTVEETRLETTRIARKASMVKKSKLEKVVMVFNCCALTYIAALNFVIFKLIAAYNVENAGFSQSAHALFKILF